MPSAHRATSLGSALRYRGREGMWAWLLHRVTGLGILLFLIVHVVDTAIVIYRPDLYDEALALYKSGFFRVAELLIFFSVLFHAANGLRVVVQDFWPRTMLRQRQMTYAVAAVVVLAMLPVTWMMISPLFGRPEPGAARYEEQQRVRHEDRLSPTPTAQAPSAGQGVAL
ncbi:MAG TPA: succinate dehydrogenase, cytochrome b556 subunit [Longimicrobiaceae bacterium]|jgi:succinate dehydrogenase / fumarate reductase cytochrome b subunit|nr:succinate dehydrogenase, cytochrome b556 subunit [Longimicrobiaceae bacterium]